MVKIISTREYRKEQERLRSRFREIRRHARRVFYEDGKSYVFEISEKPIYCGLHYMCNVLIIFNGNAASYSHIFPVSKSDEEGKKRIKEHIKDLERKLIESEIRNIEAFQVGGDKETLEMISSFLQNLNIKISRCFRVDSKYEYGIVLDPKTKEIILKYWDINQFFKHPLYFRVN